MIRYNEKICVRCAACVSESENGGIKFERGKIIIDETKNEDWHTIAAICPVGALNVVIDVETDSKKFGQI